MQIFGKLRIVAPFKSEFKLTLGYLNPALNNPTLSMKIANLPDIQLSTCFPFILFFFILPACPDTTSSSPELQAFNQRYLTILLFSYQCSRHGL